MIIFQFIANGICQGAIYGLISLGFSLIYRTIRVFDISQGATYTICPYVLFTLFRLLNLPIYISLVVGIAAGIIFTYITGTFIFYPLFKKEASAGVSLISSLGIYIFMVNIIALIYGNETKVINPGIERTFMFGNIILTRIQLFEILAFLVATPLVLIYLKSSKTGRYIRGLIDNPKLTQALGIDIKRVRIIASGIGAFLISLASCLVAFDVGFDPQIGITAILNGAVGMIIGGISSFVGSALGGLSLGIVQNLVVYQTSARWQNTITFTLLLIFLIFKPEGLLARKKRIEE
ncbi:MAG: branched-chain amino acid ABC transporter permease [bacterium]